MIALFCRPLQCRLLNIQSIDETTIRLLLPDNNAPDMQGAILLATTICPEVNHIEVFVANRPDIEYRQDPWSNDWRAYPPAPPR